jgi:hypothetical protein
MTAPSRGPVPAPPAESRFADARVWGAPAVGPQTRLGAPFGWTGLLRATARDIGSLLRDTQVRVASLSIETRGITVDLEGSDVQTRTSVLSLAHDVGLAATAIDPETGLLTARGLGDFLRYLRSADLQRRPPREFESLLAGKELRSKDSQAAVAADLERLGGSLRPLEPSTAPLLSKWKLAFPRGFTTVAIVGDSEAGPAVVEPLLAVGRLAQWARTTVRLYALERGRHGGWVSSRRP